MMRTALFATLATTLIAGSANAQSLFLRSVSEPVAVGSVQELRATSMYLVAPPEPREYAVHDIIYILINENSFVSGQQALETNKFSEYRDNLLAALDPMELLQLRLQQSTIPPVGLLDLRTEHDFEGEGAYDRNDQMIAQIAAEVIDVKPNGNLVIQAKKTVGMDQELKTLVLSGIIRQEDITFENTLLSSQIADLRIDMQHEGELRKSTEKGIFTRAIETLFAF